MTKYCPKCGESLVDEAKFCKNCGESLSNIPPSSPFQSQIAENSHTLAIILGYVFALLIPLIGIFIAVYLMTRESSKASKHGKYIIALSVLIWILGIIFAFGI